MTDAENLKKSQRGSFLSLCGVKNISELASLTGISKQALYKKLKKIGVSAETLRSAEGISPEQLALLQGLIPSNRGQLVDVNQTVNRQPNSQPDSQPNSQPNRGEVDGFTPLEGEKSSEVDGFSADSQPTSVNRQPNSQPVDVNQTVNRQPNSQPGISPEDDQTEGKEQYRTDRQPSDPVSDPAAACQADKSATDLTAPEMLVAMQEELESLKGALAEERRRADLAEVKAASAVEERDYLRAQLENAIKASALASMKRLEASSSETDGSTEAPKGWRERIRKAWASLKGV